MILLFRRRLLLAKSQANKVLLLITFGVLSGRLRQIIDTGSGWC